MRGYLRYIEVDNFKSYPGEHIFVMPTADLDPNGCRNSNLMLAISFVLGEKTNNLHVEKLCELIHGASIGQAVANSASVTLVYEDSDTGRQTRFSRLVIDSSSEYEIDKASVSEQDYAEKLGQLGINVKTRNILVYRGAVESIAMKNPREIHNLKKSATRMSTRKRT